MVPYFKFLWIMSKSQNTADKNELLRRVEQYTSTMKLLRDDSPVEHSCSIVTSLDQLIASLKPIPGFMPVFVLIGHGYAETGAMPMWSGEQLEPNALLLKWKCNFKCDVIACGCGANVFVSPMQYPILLYYNRQVRFLAAAEPLNETSHIYTDGAQQRHLELTQLMLQYLMVYDDGGTQPEITKADAFVQTNRRTARQMRQQKDNDTITKQVNERINGETARINKECMEKDELRRTELKKWADNFKQQWQGWARMAQWRDRLTLLFSVVLACQFLYLLMPHSTGSFVHYALVDIIVYWLATRQ